MIDVSSLSYEEVQNLEKQIKEYYESRKGLMTEDELYQIFLDMREERKVARKLPLEPSRMDFAMKVAEIAYERGYEQGAMSNGGYF